MAAAGLAGLEGAEDADDPGAALWALPTSASLPDCPPPGAVPQPGAPDPHGDPTR